MRLIVCFICFTRFVGDGKFGGMAFRSVQEPETASCLIKHYGLAAVTIGEWHCCRVGVVRMERPLSVMLKDFVLDFC